jgi:hypothetical protein
MSYYTEFKLKITTPDCDEYDIITHLKNTCDYANQALQNNGETNDSSGWRSYMTDLEKFSLLYPNALFELKGYGEDSEHIWIAYFKNGDSYQEDAKIIFPEFDISKLS